LSTLDENGKWPDSEVDYTTGCEARRANWPAQTHWNRTRELFCLSSHFAARSIAVVAMAAAWYRNINDTDQSKSSTNADLLNGTTRAMNYWFSRDFTDEACLGSGGAKGSSCTCENPNNWLWNTNWYSNVILIPKYVGATSLLLRDVLTPDQVAVFKRMATRSYEYNVKGLTGANVLDVARIAMDFALLTDDTDFLAEAYQRSHQELVIMNKVKADGIRADGAFGISNAILGAEIEAAGTEYGADTTSQTAFGTLFEGNSWMIIRNTLTNVLHWDFSALGRFITFPVADLQATGDIRTDLSLVAKLGQLWNSKQLSNFASSLSAPSNVNAGGLVGNRMFFTNDYMVHRGHNYVSTLKMWSSRTRHTECTNSQNPLGFHLADGVSYTHIQGNEYEDIAAAWDWNIIPGITTDYGVTALTCANTKRLGLESFVGGASDGNIGLAAMRYTNPVTKALKWQKAWFYLPGDVQRVIVSSLSSSSIPKASLVSVLDQRRHVGPVVVDGVPVTTPSSSNFTGAQTLWHGGVGCQFALNTGASISVQTGVKTGDWAAIGVSTQPPAVVDLFAAWIQHQGSDAEGVVYDVFPGTESAEAFEAKRLKARVRTLQSADEREVSAVMDDRNDIFMGVFWDARGGSVTFKPNLGASLTITVDGGAAVVYKMRDGALTVSDPSQSLSEVTVTLSWGEGDVSSWWSGSREEKKLVPLPQGGIAGASVSVKL
ncbi:hypothetical protein H0H81_001850, partial [Sphagnurus paluster]